MSKKKQGTIIEEAAEVDSVEQVVEPVVLNPEDEIDQRILMSTVYNLFFTHNATGDEPLEVKKLSECTRGDLFRFNDIWYTFSKVHTFRKTTNYQVVEYTLTFGPRFVTLIRDYTVDVFENVIEKAKEEKLKLKANETGLESVQADDTVRPAGEVTEGV